MKLMKSKLNNVCSLLIYECKKKFVSREYNVIYGKKKLQKKQRKKFSIDSIMLKRDCL